jgi:hypothetical protein
MKEMNEMLHELESEIYKEIDAYDNDIFLTETSSSFQKALDTMIGIDYETGEIDKDSGLLFPQERSDL